MNKRIRVLHICVAFLLSLTTVFSCMTFPSEKAVQAASKPKVLIANFDRLVDKNHQEMDDGYLPKLKKKVKNMK